MLINAITKGLQRVMDEELTSNSNTLLLYYGFDERIIQASQTLGIKHFTGVEKEKYFDYRSENSHMLLSNFLGHQGIKWAFYEEFIALTELLNDFSVFPGEIVLVKNNLFDDYYPIPVPITNEEADQIFSRENGNESKIPNYYSDHKVIDNLSMFSFVNRHYEDDIKIKVTEKDLFIAYTVDIAVDALDDLDIAERELLQLKYRLYTDKLTNHNIKIHAHKMFDQATLLPIQILATSCNSVVSVILSSQERANDNSDRHLDIPKGNMGDTSEIALN